jgi:uncharacterized protein YggE
MRNALLAAILVIAAPSAAGAQAPAQVEPPAVAVSGEGLATVAPDIAVVTSGVVTRAAAAGDALKANSTAMAKVLDALKTAGVAERDIGTSALSVQPQYDYGDGGAPRAPKLVGYEVRNVVTVRSRQLDGLGRLLDGLVSAGSNQIEGLSFDVSDRNGKLDEARRKAVEDARRKAALYAESAGVRLGAVLSIDEQEIGGDQPVRLQAMRAKAMDSAPEVPIARGEMDLRARVIVRWAIER